MAPLQILRHALKERGATLTLTWLDGPGYCIVVDDVTEAGEPVRWIVEDGRLDQAIQRLLVTEIRPMT